MAPLTFVEVDRPAVASDPIEVVLPSAVMLRVRAGFDDTTLRRLLDVLDGRR